MARNGSGVQTSPGASYPAVASTLIESAKFNAVVDDINSVLTLSLAADGQTTVTGDQSMNTHKHTNLLSGTARGDNTALGQLQDSVVNWVVATGTVDAITATYSPAITALIDGQVCCVRSIGANTSATPTFAPNGLTARTIVKNGGGALVAGNIGAAGFEFMLRYNLANTRWELLNSASNQNLTGVVTSVGNATTLSLTKAQLDTAISDGNAVYVNDTPALVGTNFTGTAASLTAGTATNVTGTAVVTGAISSSSPSAGIGYATGAGGTVTQITSAGTAVTLDKLCGRITMFSQTYTAGVYTYAFNCNNTSVDAGDSCICSSIGSGFIITGECQVNVITFRIFATVTFTASPVINFTVIKSVTS